MKISIINGPNLHLLGKREPSIYGDQSFITYFNSLKVQFPEIIFDYFQSNVEGELINKLHEIGFTADAILLNLRSNFSKLRLSAFGLTNTRTS